VHEVSAVWELVGLAQAIVPAPNGLGSPLHVESTALLAQAEYGVGGEPVFAHEEHAKADVHSV
jgi:hypothetical protein